jgi:RNA polymerase sigma-70 factor (ECF subfamily)
VRSSSLPDEHRIDRPAASPGALRDGVAHGAEAHRLAAWRYLRALGARADEADDLCQEAMLVALASAVPADPAAASAFVRGIARNLWLRSRRWWQRRREREIAAAVDELWLATAEPDGGEELVTRLRECVGGLQPRARTALELHYRDGLTWPQVAGQIGLRANGTKTLVQRARQALRQCIERRRR